MGRPSEELTTGAVVSLAFMMTKVVQGVGAEVMEVVDGKIKEIRDYHRSLPAQAA